MRRVGIAKGLAACVLSTVAAASAQESRSELEDLFEAQAWFKLRDAVNEQSPPSYRGAVAASFQDLKEAEGFLQPVIRDDPDSKTAQDARGLLLNAYHRAGRPQDAARLAEAMLVRAPDDANLQTACLLFATLAKYPRQTVSRRRHSRVRYSMEHGNLFLPLTINGQPARYFMDSGAGFSILTESEAKRLGMRIEPVTIPAGTSSGVQTLFSLAVAERLEIGEIRVENVAFFVAGDHQQPFLDLPQERRGGIGLPVLLAVGGARWTSDGEIEFGFSSGDKDVRKSNLSFDGDKPVVEILFQGKQLPTILDTGAAKTQLYPRFAEDFAAQLQASGERTTTLVTGVAGSVELDSVSLPHLALTVGGVETILRPARVLLEHTDSQSRTFYGNLGVDLLNQASEATINLRAMTLTLKR